MDVFVDSVVPQFGATLLGGIFAVAGVVLAFRLERNARARDEFDRAVDEIMYRLDDLASATDDWQKRANIATYAPGDFPPSHPHPGQVSIAIEIALLKARKRRDRAALQVLGDGWNDVAQARGRTQSSACGVLANAIVKWRRGDDLDDVTTTVRFARKLEDMQE